MKHSLFKALTVIFCALYINVTAMAAEMMADQKNQLPDIGTAAVSTLSLDKERLYGDAMMRSVRASQPIIQDPVLIEYINNLGNNLLLGADDVNYKFHFFMLNNPELNAFAFFAGHIGVHSGLIVTAETESELASVLSHEIAHVTQRHLARKMEAQANNSPMTVAGMITGVLLALVNPQAGFAALSTTMAAGQQASINYTRSNEKEADRVGMSILVNSGYDPNGAPNFFRKMADQYRYTSKPPAMLLTHPLPESRITDIRNRAQMYPARLLPANLSFELAKSRISVRYGNQKGDIITVYRSMLHKKQYKIKQAAQYGLALALLDDKQYKESETILQELLAQDSRNLFYLDALTDVYIGQKRFKEILAKLGHLHTIMPNNQVVTLNYANAALEAKEYDLSAGLLMDFIIIHKDHFLANQLLTDVYEGQKKMAPMHSQKAEVYALLGLYSQAIDELQTAYNFSPKKSLMQKRIKARILQFQEKEDELKRL